MDAKPIKFDKYDDMGAYHWLECNRRSSNYNPPLEARYQAVVDTVRRCDKRSLVLDVGCGDGYLLNLLSSMCEAVRGIDAEDSAIRIANQALSGASYANCEARVGSCYELPFESGCYDVVTFTDVIEHLEDPEAALREISRVLKVGGKLILTTPKFRPDRVWDPLHVIEFTEDQLHTCLSTTFSDIRTDFFWPMRWSNAYSTKVGWKAIKYYSRIFGNPFLKFCKQGDSERYGMFLVVCTKTDAPRSP